MDKMTDSGNKAPTPRRTRGAAVPVLLGTVTGALAGAVAALLLAPRAGEEMQEELRHRGQALRQEAERRIQGGRDRAGQTLHQARATVADWLDRGSDILGEQAEGLRQNERESKIPAR